MVISTSTLWILGVLAGAGIFGGIKISNVNINIGKGNGNSSKNNKT